MEGGDENRVESEGVGIFSSDRLSAGLAPLLPKSNFAGPLAPDPLPPPVSLLIPPFPPMARLNGVDGVIAAEPSAFGVW